MELKVSKKSLNIMIVVTVVIVALVILQLLLTSKNKNITEASCTGNSCSSEQNLGEVEKIQVVHFHATQQCWTCTTVGKFAKKTVTDSFPEEFNNGKIEFLDVNMDLSENNEITSRFRASGSSLFINVISDGKDHITEDVKVWQLVSDEENYINYLENKLRGYLE